MNQRVTATISMPCSKHGANENPFLARPLHGSFVQFLIIREPKTRVLKRKITRKPHVKLSHTKRPVIVYLPKDYCVNVLSSGTPN